MPNNNYVINNIEYKKYLYDIDHNEYFILAKNMEEPLEMDYEIYDKYDLIDANDTEAINNIKCDPKFIFIIDYKKIMQSRNMSKKQVKNAIPKYICTNNLTAIAYILKLDKVFDIISKQSINNKVFSMLIYSIGDSINSNLKRRIIIEAVYTNADTKIFRFNLDQNSVVYYHTLKTPLKCIYLK
jgi:hypothetical protein